MKKIISFSILILFLAIPALAQEGGVLQVGEVGVEYDASQKINDFHTVYKKDDMIILSVFDTDENGQPDLWLRYDQDGILNLEISDSNGDSEPDTFVSLDAEENVTDVVAPEFKPKEVVLPKNPNPKAYVKPVVSTERDYFVVGPPPTENKFSFPFKWGLFIIVLAALAYLIKSKKLTFVKKEK